MGPVRLHAEFKYEEATLQAMLAEANVYAGSLCLPEPGPITRTSLTEIFSFVDVRNGY
jgi:hypothetical protein